MWKPRKCRNSPHCKAYLYERSEGAKGIWLGLYSLACTHKHIRLMPFTSSHLLSVYLALSHSPTLDCLGLDKSSVGSTAAWQRAFKNITLQTTCSRRGEGQSAESGANIQLRYLMEVQKKKCTVFGSVEGAGADSATVDSWQIRALQGLVQAFWYIIGTYYFTLYTNFI